MNKKYLFSLIALCAIGIVSASYIVNSFYITINVLEPFEVQYTIINNTNCDAQGLTWNNGQDVDISNIYPGENRLICAKINNLAQANITYTYTINSNCNIFGNLSVNGSAAATTITIDSINISIDQSTLPTDNCTIEVSISRG